MLEENRQWSSMMSWKTANNTRPLHTRIIEWTANGRFASFGFRILAGSSLLSNGDQKTVCPMPHTRPMESRLDSHSGFNSSRFGALGAFGGVPLFVRHPKGKKLSRIFSQSASRVISPASLRSFEIDAPVTPCISGTKGPGIVSLFEQHHKRRP